MKQLIPLLREIIWGLRVRKCWRQSKKDYGQFLSLIGFNIAYGKLPCDILERCGIE